MAEKARFTGGWGVMNKPPDEPKPPEPEPMAEAAVEPKAKEENLVLHGPDCPGIWCPGC